MSHRPFLSKNTKVDLNVKVQGQSLPKSKDFQGSLYHIFVSKLYR